MFQGSIVALVTPFADGKIDEQALGGLVEFHLTSGTHGLSPCGTTGESATLTPEEHQRVISIVIEASGGRVPVIAGTGSNNTDEAISLTRYAKSAGASGALLITPYYNRPTQRGLYEHYRTIAQSVDLPLIVYNVPSRTGVNLLPETIAQLAAFDNIVAVKEATGSLQQASDILALCGDRITLLSGDDFTAFAAMAVGGRGTISVTANIVPKEMAQMANAVLCGDYAGAKKWHDKVYPLHAALFLETNPVPVKEALSKMGRCRSEVRLPLCAMSDAHSEKLASVMGAYGLIT